MRIPFPERVNLSYALTFAGLLSAIQIIEGTNPFFSGCVFCFILVAAVAFNIAGGFPYPSGAYIGFNAIFTTLVPMLTKVVLREPADQNLRSPQRTIEMYLLGMVGMLVAAAISRRFRPRYGFISDLLPKGSLRSAYIGCAVLSAILLLYLSFFNTGQNGSLGSFLTQANRFPILTFVLGVIYTIYRTNGKSSMSLPLVGMMLYFSLGALVSFSKDQLLVPFFTWAVTAAYMGYRLRWYNIVALLGGCYFIVVFFFPYAQFGRGYQTTMSSYELTGYLLTHMDEIRASDAENSSRLGNVHYYNERMGFLDRLDFISGDSALIDTADRDGRFGFEPIVEGFENLVPHAFYPNKPVPNFGNLYAHQIGIVADEDFATGVSFTPTADAYREDRIRGVLVVEPLLLTLIFVVLDSVIGDVRYNPIGLLTTILVARASAESALWGAPILIGQALFTNVLAAYVCAYVLPMLGAIFNRQFAAGGSSTEVLRQAAPSSS